MGHEWWIFAAGCVALTFYLLRLHRRRQRRRSVTNKLANYVGPDLVANALAEPFPPAEFREISILSTNLTGYVSFCETAGDDEAVAAINAHLSLLVPIVRQHRGLISEFLGDGTISLFGAPRNDPDHAASAVAAALELLQAHQPLLDQLRSRGLPEMPLRIGIATGRVIVGDVGPQSTYGALGNAMNISMWLQVACKAACTGLLISPRTAECIAGRFQLRRLPLPPKPPAGEFAFEVVAPLHQDQQTPTGNK